MHALLKTVTKSTGVTTLHVTHSSDEADALANRRFVFTQCVIEEPALQQQKDGAN